MNESQLPRISKGRTRSLDIGWLFLPVFVAALLLHPTVARCSPPPVFLAADFMPLDTGAGSQSVAMEDLNADGKQDLVTANPSANTVSVLMGNGDGTFGARTDFGTGLGPNSIAIGDLNGDGMPDVATANGGSNTVSVLLGSGDGTFGPPADFGTGLDPTFVVIRDLDMDGSPDLATANTDGNSVSVLLGNGDGTFGANSDFAAGSSQYQYGRRSLAIEDLDMDGDLDLATANDDYAQTVSVLLGNGDGTFGARSDYGVEGYPDCVAVGDLNGDGRPDLAAGNGWGGSVSVLPGNGDGTFGTYYPLLDALHCRGDVYDFIAIRDLNADGRPDLSMVAEHWHCYGPDGGNIVCEYLFSTVSILLANSSGGFGAETEFATAIGAFSIAIGDANADGKLDLVTAPAYYAGPLAVLLGNGDGTFGAHADFTTGLSPNYIAVGDLNADGKPDVVTASAADSPSGSMLSVLLGNGDGTLGTKTDFATGSYAASVAIGDLNADGNADLATARVSVLLGNGDGTFGAGTDFGTGYSPWCVAIGDLNADGKPDLVTTKSGFGVSTVSVLLGNGDGTFGAGADFATGPVAESVAIGDLNADGKLDLVTASSSSNTVSVLLGNGDGSFGAATDFVTGASSSSVAVGDLNADGKPDLVTGSYNSNTVSVLLGNGDGTFGANTDFVTGSALGRHPVAIGDLNADGELDIATTNQSSYTVSVLLGNGDGSFAAKTEVGTGPGPCSIAIAYMNGDLKPDLVTAGNYDDTVSVLRNLGPSTITSVSLPAGEADAPRRIRLEPAFPNPIGARAQFRYGLPHAGQVRLMVYDVQGRRVAMLVDQSQGPGWCSIGWDGRDERGRGVASGMYFARLEAGGEVRVTKIVVAR